MDHTRVSSLVLLLALSAAPTAAQVTDDRPLPPPVSFVRDSGVLANTEPIPRVLATEVVTVPGAQWLRLYFGDVKLARGSFLRITSALDGEVQELDLRTLRMWSHTSAYFNGDTISVDLVGGPRSSNPQSPDNQLVIEKLAFDTGTPDTATLCGADDRYPTDVLWSGRTLPNGCTAALWSQSSCLLSAGHCFDNPSDGQTLEFHVPLNDAQCNWQHPPVADQFPILDRDFQDAGVGSDWAVARVGTNSLGQTPFERYGAYRPIAASIPANGQPVSITGYGTTSTCETSQIQQMSTGALTSIGGTSISHDSDTTGGNSGSAVVHDDEVIAVHTHGGCPSNRGTRVDQTAFALARVNVCYGIEGALELDRSGYGCGVSMAITVHDASLIGAGTQAVTVTSTSEPSGETVILNEVHPGMLVASLPTTVGPVISGDGLLSSVDGDTITATYVDADGGFGGTPVDRVVLAATDCVSPTIQSVQVAAVSATSAQITWQTDEAARGSVTYGTAVPDTTLTAALPYVTSHDFTLPGLLPCSSYVFSVRAEDPTGNAVIDDNSGNLYGFATACPEPPAVADGTGASTPLRLRRAGNGQIRVSWDDSCQASGSNKILHGPIAQVATYQIDGAVCGLDPASSSFQWILQPNSYWILVVRDDVDGVESSWGQSSFGERNGPLASGECGVTIKNPAQTCP